MIENDEKAVLHVKRSSLANERAVMTLFLAALIWTGFAGNAVATIIQVTPNPCPLPAEAKPYSPPADITATPADDQFDISGHILILKDMNLPGADEEGLFVRLAIDSRTGLPFAISPNESCFLDKY